MNKRELYSYTRRFYARLRDPQFVFKLKRSKGFCGTWYPDKRIELDPDKDILPTVIHELLHDIHPGADEELILKIESALFHQLSYKQIVNLMGATAEALKRNIHKRKKG